MQPEHANAPSRVIHFRNVGPDVTQHDLLVLATGFGSVEQVLMLKSKNQALLQFTELTPAISFMQYYSTVQANIRGRNVYPQFSSHQELSSSTGVIATQQGGSGDPNSANGNAGAPNRILLVTINNAIYPITVDILYQVFGSHGMVEKIVIFNKTKGLQALVQYQNIASATSAKESLHGQNIYTNGSCQLHIQYSNLTSELTVTANNDRTKDFTKPLPAIAPEVQAPGLQPMRNPGLQGGGIPVVGGPSQFVPGMGPMPGAEFYGQQAAQQFVPNAFMGGSQFNSVLLVSNLNEEKINCTQLFNLFSSYGNVMRVKILHNKPDHALVQMGDYYQASTAMHYLKGLTLWDKPVDINFSKHAYINATSQDPADPSCADYTNSPLNRFKFNQGTEKAQQIYKNMSGPVSLLHVSNLPATSTNATVTEMFAPFGAITGIKVFDINGKRQALVQFDSVQHSAEALVTLHNSQVDGRGLKLSFSKNKL
jgi:polypyrimidine tract-binding protein 2